MPSTVSTTIPSTITIMIINIIAVALTITTIRMAIIMRTKNSMIIKLYRAPRLML